MKKFNKEHFEQKCLFQWANLNKLNMPALNLMFAIPNGGVRPFKFDKDGNRYSTQANKLKAEGVKAGVPDIFLPYPKGKHHGLFIELKVGNVRPTENQAMWMKALSKVGYKAALCYGFEEARDVIKTYLEVSK